MHWEQNYQENWTEKSVRVKFRILKSILRSKFVEHCTLCMVCCWERHDYQFWNGRLVIDTQFYRFKINKETYVSKKNIQKIHSVYYTHSLIAYATTSYD